MTMFSHQIGRAAGRPRWYGLLAGCLLSALATLTGSAADELKKEKEIVRLASLGRTGEAEKLARVLSTPYALYYRAMVLSKDDRWLRAKGVREFDPELSDELARKALPLLQKGATAQPAYARAIGRMYALGVGVK